jgi:hypothetical protein
MSGEEAKPCVDAVGWTNPVFLVGNFGLVAGGGSCYSQDAGVAKGICGNSSLDLHNGPATGRRWDLPYNVVSKDTIFQLALQLNDATTWKFRLGSKGLPGGYILRVMY